MSTAASADPALERTEELIAATAIDDLTDRLGHVFVDPGLLVHALTHRSWCAEHPGSSSNERLEFLGDAILGMAVTDHIYEAHPLLAEGQLAKVRAAVVSSVTLSGVARDLRLGESLLLGKGEESSGGRNKASILADAMEAVIGAVYLDGGWLVARSLVVELFWERLENAAEKPGTQDHKTRLQERSAQWFESLPRYDHHAEGPDHDKRFYATVRLGGELWGSGEGRSKKEAEQAAASAAWRRLAEHERKQDGSAT